MKKILIFVVILLISIVSVEAYSFQGKGCAEGTCVDCHSLDMKEAALLLGDGADKILEVENSEVPGLWEVKLEKNKNNYLLYIDYSKKYVVSGDVFRIKDKVNVTRKRMGVRERPEGVKIPLDDALLVGNKDGKKRVVVFTDPRCPYCKKLHEELKIAVRKDPDLLFFIKLFPLKIHPDSFEVSKSILCSPSLSLLEDSLNGKQIPPATCKTKVVEENIEIGNKLGIHSTPTLIFPDGRIIPGYKKAGEILDLMKGSVKGGKK